MTLNRCKGINANGDRCSCYTKDEYCARHKLRHTCFYTTTSNRRCRNKPVKNGLCTVHYYMIYGRYPDDTNEIIFESDLEKYDNLKFPLTYDFIHKQKDKMLKKELIILHKNWIKTQRKLDRKKR